MLLDMSSPLTVDKSCLLQIARFIKLTTRVIYIHCTPKIQILKAMFFMRTPLKRAKVLELADWNQMTSVSIVDFAMFLVGMQFYIGNKTGYISLIGKAGTEFSTIIEQSKTSV